MLEPNWNQEKPTPREAQTMCQEVLLEPISFASEATTTVLDRLRATHLNGGAILTGLHVGPNPIFDWFASRNRLLEYEILPTLLCRDDIRRLIPELQIPATLTMHTEPNACTIAASGRFKFDNPFVFDGWLAQNLYAG